MFSWNVELVRIRATEFEKDQNMTEKLNDCKAAEKDARNIGTENAAEIIKQDFAEDEAN